MGIWVEFNLQRMVFSVCCCHTQKCCAICCCCALASNSVTLFIWFDLILVYFILFGIFCSALPFLCFACICLQAGVLRSATLKGLLDCISGCPGRGHFVCLCYCLASAQRISLLWFYSVVCVCVCVSDTMLFKDCRTFLPLSLSPSLWLCATLWTLFSGDLFVVCPVTLTTIEWDRIICLNNAKYTYLFRGSNTHTHTHTLTHTQADRETPNTVINVVVGFRFAVACCFVICGTCSF